MIFFFWRINYEIDICVKKEFWQNGFVQKRICWMFSFFLFESSPYIFKEVGKSYQFYWERKWIGAENAIKLRIFWNYYDKCWINASLGKKLLYSWYLTTVGCRLLMCKRTNLSQNSLIWFKFVILDFIIFYPPVFP